METCNPKDARVPAIPKVLAARFYSRYTSFRLYRTKTVHFKKHSAKQDPKSLTVADLSGAFPKQC